MVRLKSSLSSIVPSLIIETVNEAIVVPAVNEVVYGPET